MDLSCQALSRGTWSERCWGPFPKTLPSFRVVRERVSLVQTNNKEAIAYLDNALVLLGINLRNTAKKEPREQAFACIAKKESTRSLTNIFQGGKICLNIVDHSILRWIQCD